MKLITLLKPWVSLNIADCDILEISNDSRKIKPGSLFIAYPGAATDGRNYIQEAISQGAAAVVYEPDSMPSSLVLPSSVPCVALQNLSGLLADIASRFYCNPSKSMYITGVTGTNGKTTIAYQLSQAHTLLGSPTAYIGTLGHGDIKVLQPLMNTTPDALCLQHLLYDYKQKGIHQICMEVSSHALCEGRVDKIPFKQAIFTNLSHEHLDYHGTLEAYADAKASLFATSTLQYAIINNDDQFADKMDLARPNDCKKLTYGLKEGCDLKASNISMSMLGSVFDVSSPFGNRRLHTKTVGAFNIYNSLAVYSSLLAYGYPIDKVVSVMSQLKSSPGRMEVIAENPCVIIDYAHTPDALENVLSTLVKLKDAEDDLNINQTKPSIWVVFGCGGDRDKTKRPMMGRIASLLADKAIITSDNPRTEDPDVIMDEIAKGLISMKNVIKIKDRKEAIEYALEHASLQDIILIAGKGHETYQQIGHQRFNFSDHSIVLNSKRIACKSTHAIPPKD